TIKTDPKYSDYKCEIGCKRAFEPWHEHNVKMEDEEKKREEEKDGLDAMEELERNTLQMRRQMKALDVLDELKSMSAVKESVSSEQLLEMKKKELEKQEEE